MDKLTTTATVKDVGRTSPSGRTRFTMIASTEAIDRDNEIIDPAGWEWGTPLPKLYYGHGPYSDPYKHIGKLTGIRVEGGHLVVDGELSDDIEEHHVARLVGKQLRAGDLDQGSVGFIPKEWEDLDPVKAAGATRRYKRQELIEFSLVGVPSQMQSELIALRSLLPDEFETFQPLTSVTWSTPIPVSPGAVAAVIDVRTPMERWFAEAGPKGDPGALLSRALLDRLTTVRDEIDAFLASATRAENERRKEAA